MFPSQASPRAQSLVALDFDAVLAANGLLARALRLARSPNVTLVVSSDRAIGEIALACAPLGRVWLVGDGGRVCVDRARHFDTRPMSLTARLAEIARTVGAEQIIYGGPHAYAAAAECPNIVCMAIAEGGAMADRFALLDAVESLTHV
jgi:hypothetical protein